MPTECSRDLFGFEAVEGRQVVAAFDGGLGSRRGVGEAEELFEVSETDLDGPAGGVSLEEGANGDFAPIVRDVEMRNVSSRKSNYALYLRGLEKGTIADIRVIDCTFDQVANPNVVERVDGLVNRNTKINGLSSLVWV
jgi:hypothetical protein